MAAPHCYRRAACHLDHGSSCLMSCKWHTSSISLNGFNRSRIGWIGIGILAFSRTEIIGVPIAESSTPNSTWVRSAHTIPSRHRAPINYLHGCSDLNALTSGESIFASRLFTARVGAHNAHSVFCSQIGATIFDVAYGIKALPEEDPFINLAETTVSFTASATIPGRFLVETISMLKHVPAWMPGASFQVLAQEGRVVLRDTAELPFDQVKRAMVGYPFAH